MDFKKKPTIEGMSRSMMDQLKFLATLIAFSLGTILVLMIALAPLMFYLEFVLKANQWYLLVTAPIGISLTWLLGCLIFIVLHGRMIVPLTLPAIKPGEYSMYSSQARRYFLRLGADNIAKYWVKTLEWIPFMAQTFLYPFMLRQYGVKLGKGVYVSTETRIDGIPLIEIGARTFIAPRAVIGAHINHHGSTILFKPVKIGKGCFIGHNSVVTPGAIIEDEAIIGAFSALLLDTHVPPREVWAGLPATPLKKSKVRQERLNDDS